MRSRHRLARPRLLRLPITARTVQCSEDRHRGVERTGQHAHGAGGTGRQARRPVGLNHRRVQTGKAVEGQPMRGKCEYGPQLPIPLRLQ